MRNRYVEHQQTDTPVRLSDARSELTWQSVLMAWVRGGWRATLSIGCGSLALLGGACTTDAIDNAPSTTVVTEPPSTASSVSSTSTTSSSVPDSIPPAGPDLQPAQPGSAISFDGAGDMRIGQRVDPSLVQQYEPPSSCGYWGLNEPPHDGDEPLSGLVAAANTSDPTVRSIMVRSSSYRTASGVGIGTSLATLQRIYGNDLVLDRLDELHQPTDGLVAYYNDVAAIRNGDRALTFALRADQVAAIKVSAADFWGDDEGCA